MDSNFFHILPNRNCGYVSTTSKSTCTDFSDAIWNLYFSQALTKSISKDPYRSYTIRDFERS